MSVSFGRVAHLATDRELLTDQPDRDLLTDQPDRDILKLRLTSVDELTDDFAEFLREHVGVVNA